MTGCLDDIVPTTYKPVITMVIAFCQITGEIPPVQEAFMVAFFIIEIPPEHGWPARLNSQFPFHIPSPQDLDPVFCHPGNNGHLDPRQAADPWSPDKCPWRQNWAIIIPPVSVCHQLSWTGRPRTSRPHTTASGLRGSPTLWINRRWVRLNCSRGSVPMRISLRIAVGAVYQTLTRSRSKIRYQRPASKSASSTILVIPWSSGAIMP